MIKLEGIPELKKALEKALLKHSERDVRKALTRGANIIVDAAKARVTIPDGGRLKESIKILPKWSKDPMGVYVAPKILRRITSKTSQKRKDANPFYAHWWEYGTDPHDLRYQGKFISGTKGGQHPGTRQTGNFNPYMRPAYDNNKQAALNVMLEDLAKMIES